MNGVLPHSLVNISYNGSLIFNIEILDGYVILSFFTHSGREFVVIKRIFKTISPVYDVYFALKNFWVFVSSGNTECVTIA